MNDCILLNTDTPTVFKFIISVSCCCLGFIRVIKSWDCMEKGCHLKSVFMNPSQIGLCFYMSAVRVLKTYNKQFFLFPRHFLPF